VRHQTRLPRGLEIGEALLPGSLCSIDMLGRRSRHSLLLRAQDRTPEIAWQWRAELGRIAVAVRQP